MNTSVRMCFDKKAYRRLFILDGYQRVCPAMVLVDLSVGIQHGIPVIYWDVAWPAGGHADGAGGIFSIPDRVIRDCDIHQFMDWLKSALCQGCAELTDFKKVEDNFHLRKMFARNSKIKIEQDKNSPSGKTRLTSFLMVYNEQIQSPYDYAIVDLIYGMKNRKPVIYWDVTFPSSNRDDDGRGGCYPIPDDIIRKNNHYQFVSWLKKTVGSACAERIDWDFIWSDPELRKWLSKQAERSKK